MSRLDGLFQPHRSKSGIKHHLLVWVLRALILVGLIALLQYYVDQRGRSSGLFLAPPSKVGHVLVNWHGIRIRAGIESTIKSVVFAYIIGCMAGFLVATAVWLGRRSHVGAWLESLVAVLYNIPRVVLIPLFILWFGLAAANATLFGAVSVAFIMFYHVLAGFTSAPDRLMNGVAILGGHKLDQIRWVVLPSAGPVILTGLLIAVPQAVTAVIAAEMLTGSGGLGALAQSLSGAFNAAGVFAVAVVASVIGVALNFVVTRSAHLVGFDRRHRGAAGVG